MVNIIERNSVQILYYSNLKIFSYQYFVIILGPGDLSFSPGLQNFPPKSKPIFERKIQLIQISIFASQ